MLWTLGGVCLLFGFGVVVGAGGVLFVRARAGAVAWVGLGAFVGGVLGALHLVMQWMGPAGGGG